MENLDWQLGTIVAILISITASFSVDYVMHLSGVCIHRPTYLYMQKANCCREEKVTESFEEMRVSVFSGMASFMTSFILFFCQIQFFYT
jgi:hypothetical protein